MKNLFKYAAVFTVGLIGGQVMMQFDIDKGEVIHEDDDIYVKVSPNKSSGWSFARVNYKHPTK